MKDSSNDNGKVSDSGYTNTCVSKLQRNSDSSLSRNGSRFESSGYDGGHPSTLDSSCYALPQPINVRKNKKKKCKASATTNLDNADNNFRSENKLGKQNDLGTYDSNGSSSDFTSNGKKSEEIAGLKSVNNTGLGEYICDSNSTEFEARFRSVISVMSGLIIDTTPSLQMALGYTRESWIDHSFIEFVHPKDKQTFADHLDQNISLSYGDYDKGFSRRPKSIFCKLRKNDEGKSTAESASDENNSLAITSNQYLPFHLTTSTKFFHDHTNDEKPRMMFLVIDAEPIVPVYKVPEEILISTVFSIRHDSNCIVTHVDADVVQYFGYMPQEMIGRSLFDFYHPGDLQLIKDVYETVVKMEGAPFRSKPYRLAAKNGNYVLLETEWSCFISPWTEKLEFIIGHHRVLQGPTNPNVFETPADCQENISANIDEEVLKQSKIIEREIRAFLNEKIQRTEGGEAYKITSRSKDLDAFLKNLMWKAKPLAPLSKQRLPTDHRSFSGSQNPLLQKHNSVILGAMSPPHEYCTSKSSTETTPSYHQLNYNENITRYFDSKPLMRAMYGSDEDNTNMSLPPDEKARKMSCNLTGTKNTTLSAEIFSGVSNNRISYGSPDDNGNSCCANTIPTQNLKIPILTEAVLNKHNQVMEKILARQHKQHRRTIKNKKKPSKDPMPKDTYNKPNKQGKDETKSRGAKRPSTNCCEGKICKIPKNDESAPLPLTTSTSMNADDNSSPGGQSRQITNIWPSVKAAVPPTQLTRSQPVMMTENNGPQEILRSTGFSSFVPVYYVPLPQSRNNLVRTIVPPTSCQSSPNGQLWNGAYVSYPTTVLTGVIYPPMVCTPKPETTMYRPFVTPGPAPIHRETPLSNSGDAAQQQNVSNPLKHTGSLATSIKAEPGSIMAISESSKKPFSLGEHISSCISVDGECSSHMPNIKRQINISSQFSSTVEDSSDSSFYGSFVTTSNVGSNNPNKRNVAHAPLKPLWKPPIIQHACQDRKNFDMLRKGPPWQEGVKMTNELIYQYQLTPKPLNEVLEADMKILKNFRQPQMVNDQLAQLHSDMEPDSRSFTAKLVLCERNASTESESCSSDDNPRNKRPEKKMRSQLNRMRRRRKHIHIEKKIR